MYACISMCFLDSDGSSNRGVSTTNMIDLPHRPTKTISKIPWTCKMCTLENEAHLTLCDACGTKNPQSSTISSSSSTVAPTTKIGEKSTSTMINRCINSTCSRFSSKTGEACRLQLCSLCYGCYIQPFENDRQISENLLQLYLNQMMNGCGKQSCTNTYCASNKSFSSKDTTTTAVMALKLASAGIISNQPKFYLCKVKKIPLLQKINAK